MTLSHIRLTVSDLHSASSFFLSCLQPLGYKFIRHQGSEIALGPAEADFFLVQETAGFKAGAAELAFAAPDRVAVRDFYSAALTAGGRPSRSPSFAAEGDDCFAAAVFDADGNRIAAVYRPDGRGSHAGSVVSRDSAPSWAEGVASREAAARLSDGTGSAAPAVGESVRSGSVRQAAGASRTTLPLPVPAPVEGPAALVSTVISPLAAAARVAAAVTGEQSSKQLLGTLIGAAAGAAMVYVACKSEQSSARAEASFQVAMQQKRILKNSAGQQQDGFVLSSMTRQLYLEDELTSTQYGRAQVRPFRALEAPPSASYRSPECASIAPTSSGLQWVSSQATRSRDACRLESRSFYGGEYHQAATKVSASIAESAASTVPSSSALSADRSRKLAGADSVVGLQTVIYARDSSPAAKVRSPSAATRSLHSTAKQSTRSKKLEKRDSVASKARSRAATERTVLVDVPAADVQPPDRQRSHPPDETDTIAPSDSISCAPSQHTRASRSAHSSSRGKASASSRDQVHSVVSKKSSSRKSKGDGSVASAARSSDSTSTVRPTRKASVVTLPNHPTDKTDRKKRSVVSCAPAMR